jgi:hypothetical protein
MPRITPSAKWLLHFSIPLQAQKNRTGESLSDFGFLA